MSALADEIEKAVAGEYGYPRAEAIIERASDIVATLRDQEQQIAALEKRIASRDTAITVLEDRLAADPAPQRVALDVDGAAESGRLR